jgi:hypothetical protein
MDFSCVLPVRDEDNELEGVTRLVEMSVFADLFLGYDMPQCHRSSSHAIYQIGSSLHLKKSCS